MIVSVDISPEVEAKLQEEAKHDGHDSRSAVIRKAISFYLFRSPSKPKNSNRRQNRNQLETVEK